MQNTKTVNQSDKQPSLEMLRSERDAIVMHIMREGDEYGLLRTRLEEVSHLIIWIKAGRP